MFWLLRGQHRRRHGQADVYMFRLLRGLHRRGHGQAGVAYVPAASEGYFWSFFAVFKHYRGVQASSSLFFLPFWASLGLPGLPLGSGVSYETCAVVASSPFAGAMPYERPSDWADFQGLGVWAPVLRLPRGATLVPARLNPQDWPSLRLSGAACARRKAVRGRCPARTRKPALSKTPFFSVATQKKTLRDPPRKWPTDTKAKGLLYTLCLACFSKNFEPLRDLGVGSRARTRRSRGPRFKGRRLTHLQ